MLPSLRGHRTRAHPPPRLTPVDECVLLCFIRTDVDVVYRPGVPTLGGPGPLLCFIRTDVDVVQGTEGFPRSPHPSFAHPRRELRRAPLFLTDHCRVPGTLSGAHSGVPASATRLQVGPARLWSLEGLLSSRSH